ncbi:UDP-N-acetylglucosamine transporter-like [Paramacrobiotus metropolitanus]|uniref:UDP-N-acetylglucosamine transporter-like n=1 Tax=Paramacrobiotus metropolitanus TaxID=2943436 RepID=UPI00244580E9|nr:UDP-N-acetylglucosamine transporter-like [Paramacrobiotus metropolitanus]XP_055349077.1 UDP-N-acetylglucosamine transporter-like [Paramacrobiotus metropolitanus]
MAGDVKPIPHAGLYKFGSLVTLTLQNVVIILLIKYAKALPGATFISSTVVVLMEIFKLLASLVMLLIQHKSLRVWGRELYDEIYCKKMETLKVAVPAFIYTFQNNLTFVAVSNLDAATFQVVSQIKILTTAIFSVVMLRRQLGGLQWAALFILFIGIAVVQLDQQSPQSTKLSYHIQSPLLGLAAIIVSSLMSGFAGVYFEKILKTSEVSLWLRNVQLSMFAIPMGLLTCLLSDGDAVMSKGFFHAYNVLTWTIVLLQGFGGLTVAVVVKYADNILKGFATSFAIVFSAIASVYIFAFEIHGLFAVGSAMVIVSIFMYGYVPKKKDAKRADLNGVEKSVKHESQVPLLEMGKEEK